MKLQFKTGFTVISLAGAQTATWERDVHFKFLQFASEFNRDYSTAEEFALRLTNFEQTLQLIDEINSKYTHTAGINRFADWSMKEFQEFVSGKSQVQKPKDGPSLSMRPSPVNDATVDWVAKGVVTPVKDQLSCNAGYAFAAADAAAAIDAIKNGNLLDLSAQQYVDCSGTDAYGNNGCSGGWYQYAWSYSGDSALKQSSIYPYTGTQGACKTTTNLGSKILTPDQVYVTANSSAALIQALASNPVVVSVEADQEVFKTYVSGIISVQACGPDINHAVLAVGYGNDESGTPFIKVKNSWGTKWGIQGYALLGVADGPGVCGINQFAAFPTTSRIRSD